VKKSKFAIPALVAAGIAPLLSAAAEEQPAANDRDTSLVDTVSAITAQIGDSHEFTLAQHQSHSSHASHYSHSSHRSSSFRFAPQGSEGGTLLASVPGDDRNESSTPPNSVLPSSPAITKVKILPGNSGKFRELVVRAQLALYSQGYEVGTVDGELHARTTAAIFRFQTDRGLVPDGRLTNEVLSALGIVAQ
jgi:His-Xaa-Ser repeat protein HxsA